MANIKVRIMNDTAIQEANRSFYLNALMHGNSCKASFCTAEQPQMRFTPITTMAENPAHVAKAERNPVSDMRDTGCGMRDTGYGMRDAGLEYRYLDIFRRILPDIFQQ